MVPEKKTVSFSRQVWWARGGWLSELIARSIRPNSPPLLIMSLPRSGSSWVGKILGSAPDALFLREPINQSHLTRGGDTTVFDVDPNFPPIGYALYADRAFTGIPIFPPGAVRDTKQWSLLTRRHKQVVIKEVNPLALPWLLETYQPRVIYLARHPAAVASSYWELNWRNAEEKLSQLGPRLMEGILSPWHEAIASATGFWQAQGVFQGAVMHIATQALKACKEYKVIQYESICDDPECKLAELFEFAGLTFNDSVKRLIAESGSAKGELAKHAYSTQRNTQEMAIAWKNKVTVEQLAKLHSGYSAFKLPYYTSEDDWRH
jgi:hypothetical protein